MEEQNEDCRDYCCFMYDSRRQGYKVFPYLHHASSDEKGLLHTLEPCLQAAASSAGQGR